MSRRFGKRSPPRPSVSRSGQASCGPGPGLRVELHRAGAQLREARAPRRCRRRARRASPRGASVGSTAKPWFWLVTSTRSVRALEHRMVRAAVAERQLEGLVPGREREQLVAEADAEAPARGRAARGRPRPRRRAAPGRRARSRAARRRSAASSSGVDVVRVDGHRRARRTRAGAGSSACSRSRRPRSERVPASRVDVRLARRDAGDERAAGHRRLLADRGDGLVDRGVAGDRDRAHRARVAQVQDERARVDPGERDDARARAASPSRRARAPRA